MSRQVTVNELARMLGVHFTTVNVWRRKGFISNGIKIKRTRYWTSEQVDLIYRTYETVKERADQLSPIASTSAHGVTRWRCPVCGKESVRMDSPVGIKFHIPACPELWKKVRDELTATGGTGSAPTVDDVSRLSRTAMLAMAEDVLAGKCAPETFVAAVKARTSRIRELESALERIRGDA